METMEQLKNKALAEIEQAITPAALEDVRVEVLGKKGHLTLLMKDLGQKTPEESEKISRLSIASTTAAIVASLDLPDVDQVKTVFNDLFDTIYTKVNTGLQQGVKSEVVKTEEEIPF